MENVSNMKRLTYLRALLIVGLLVGHLTAIAEISPKEAVTVFSEHGNTMRSVVAYEATAMSTEYHNLIVRDSYINGTVTLSKYTHAVFDNVTVLNGTTIYVSDYAGLIIKNSKIYETEIVIELNASVVMDNTNTEVYSLNVYLWDYAELYFMSNGTDINIYAYNSSTISITNAFLNGSYFMLYNSSFLELTGVDIESYGQIYCYGYSMIRADTINDHNRPLYIYLNNYATMSSTNLIANGTTIYLWDFSGITDYGSAINIVDLKENSNGHFTSSVIEYCSVYGNAQATFVDSQIGKIVTSMSYYGDYQAAVSVHRSNISILDLRTPIISNITESRVNTLYYRRIYNGVLRVNETHITYSSYYENYNSSETIINTAVNVTDFIAYDADLVEFDRSTTVYVINTNDSIFYNVRTAYIFSSNARFNISNPTITNRIYASQATIIISNSNLDLGLFLSARNSSRITIENTYMKSFDILLRDSELNISDSQLINAYNFWVENCEIGIYNTFLNATSTIKSVHNSKVIFKSSNISMSVDGNVVLGPSRYKMLNMAIINDTAITYGFVDLGGNDLSGFYFMGDIYLDGTNLTILGGKQYLLTYSINIYMRGQSYLEVLNMSINALNIYGVNTSYLTLVNVSTISNLELEELHIEANDSNLVYVEAEYLYGSLSNTTFSYLNSWTYADIELRDVKATNDMFIQSGDITIVNSNISHAGFGMFEDVGIANVPTVNIYVENSNISVLDALAHGEIYIKNSELDRLTYLLTNVTVETCQITAAMKNYLITGTGTIIIDGNIIPTGTYRVLLNEISSTIWMYLEAIVVDKNPDVHLILNNSNYFALYVTEGPIDIINTELNILMVETTSANIQNVLVNASLMEGDSPPAILGGGNIEVDNLTTIMTSTVLYLGEFSIRSLNTSGIEIYNATGQINNTVLSSSYVEVSASNITIDRMYSVSPYSTIYATYSRIDMTHINMSSLYIMNSSAVIRDSVLEEIDATASSILLTNTNITPLQSESTYSIYLHDDTYLGIDRSNITDIIIVPEYRVIHAVYVSISPRNVTIDTINTDIGTAPIMYSASRIRDEIAYSDPYTEKPYMTTRYVETEIGAISSSFFVIQNKTVLNITNFKNLSITGIYAAASYDSAPPTITILSDVPIEYELGLKRKLEFVVNDEAPYVYILAINGIVLENSYESGTRIAINLWEIIDEARNYTFEITAYDIFNNIAHADGTITVFPTEKPRILSSPIITNATVGDEIVLEWEVFDHSPYRYQIYINDTVAIDMPWTGERFISYSFTPDTPGKYNITLILEDQLNQTERDIVIISVAKRAEGGIPTWQTISIALILLAVIIAVVLLLKKRKM